MHTILHTIETGCLGGAETVLLEIASGLDPARYRSLVILSYPGWLQEQLEARGIKTILVEWKAWSDFRLPRAMANLVRREKVDLIHSHLPDHNFYSCLVGRWTHRPTVVTYHGAVELTRPRAQDAFKLWFVRRTANVVVAVCDHVGGMLKKASFPPAKVLRIYNGIEHTRFANSPNGTLREELGCGKDTRLVGMVAQIREVKGYEFFIQTARRVVDAFSEVLFLAVGDDESDSGPRLRALVGSLGLGDHFRFLGFRSDVPQILSQLDVFALSSMSEGFPLSILEAMAAGKPVVVTRCGGPEEVVEDGRDGFLVPPADPEAMAARVIDLLRDRALSATFGANGQVKVAKQFSLEKMVSDYAALYDRLLPAS